MSEPRPRPRSWIEVRWRQFRDPPPPVLRAVVANLVVAAIGGVALLVYDLAIARGAILPGGDLRTAFAALYVALVVAAGSALTYLWVELPAGASRQRRRSGWAALLGLFASLPIVYLVLVVAFQVVRPMLD